MTTLNDFSNDLVAAVERGSAGTLLVDARNRYPASGIAYEADLVLTADHVITRDENLRVARADNKSFSATVAGRDPNSDLALLRLSEKALTPARVAGAAPKVGQLVLALGRPSREGVQASWGIVTAIGGPARTGRGGLLEEYIQTETTSYPGFSGGPLVNTSGEVLGLNTSGLTRGMALTIPSAFAWRIAEALAKHGSVKRGYLGVRTQGVDLPESGRTALGRDQTQGLLVMWLEETGPAEKSGMFVGDIIVAVGGQAVGDPDDLFAALNRDVVGKTIAVEILRGGKRETLQPTVGERK
ncbi:MAG TPA: trypsin-like peptidase domain-containing protein [Anaerolineales bacterium]|nr:trypsin-like peptidase domain-containing protein [Anaerolineales bacterium]